MENREPVNGENAEDRPVVRPFALTLLCLFSFVFYGFIGILFLISLFYSGWLTKTINLYIPENEYTTIQVAMIALAGFLLHGAALAGIGMIWKMRKKGYLLFGISTLVISACHLFLGRQSFISLMVYIALVILFGIFFRKLR